jgi:ABC-type amino acid transport substrate-binding protein
LKYILLSCCFLLNLYSNNSPSYNLEKINFQEEKLETITYETKENNLNLTQEQREYLKDKKELKLCVDPNWLPLEKIENNEHIGITSDFFKLISQMIETPISLVETKEWTESLEKIKRRECDILSLAEKTPSREKYLNFTKPYFSAPLVIVTKVGVPFVDNLNSIKEKSLAIVKDYSMEELLKNKYPGINLIEVKSIYEGLAYVQQDKVSGFLDNSLVIVVLLF